MVDGIQPGSWEEEPKAGSFRPVDGKGIGLSGENKERPEPGVEISEHEVEVFQTLDRALNPKKDLIFYPCCARDASPSAAFPDSRVVYVDIDELSIKTLK